jgi:hypothetical protein
MSTAAPQEQVVQPFTQDPDLEVTVIGHSYIVYWWPVWAVGYLMAILTYVQGVDTTFGDVTVRIHPSRTLGVIFTVVFLLVIAMTHITVRGTASVTVIVSLLTVTLFFAWMGWWEDILKTMGRLAIFMNLGFYVFFSSAVFLVWALAVFAFDRMEYWEFRPGQAVYHTVMGGGEQTYDTRGMSVEKQRNDLFRHWILGLGAGDIHISATGAKQGEFYVRNVLFVNSKMAKILRLTSMKPGENLPPIQTGHHTV